MNIFKYIPKRILVCFSGAILISLLNSCQTIGNIWDPADARTVPANVEERVKKNLEEGKGFSLKKVMDEKGSSGTSYQFASSNPMWRASLEVLDFLPMTTVDYSGGMIISDWYTDNNSDNESIKITIRFLSNEIRSDSLKIIVHKKKCASNQACQTKLLNNSKISQELRSTILTKAAELEKESKNKKKK